MSEKYHDKELNELAMDKMSKHFYRWLPTHPPEKAKHIHEDLLQGEWGVDFHLKPTPNYEEEVEELLDEIRSGAIISLEHVKLDLQRLSMHRNAVSKICP